MSDPNPPEQPSFNRPAGGDPTTPLPSSQPASPGPGGHWRTRRRRRPGRQHASPAAARGADGWTGRHVEHPRPPREGAGFFTALFDFSFTNFVTPILVRFVYLLATVALVVELAHLRLRRLRPERRDRSRRAHPRAGLRRHLPRRHPHDPRVLPLGRAHERGHPQAPPPGLTPGRRPTTTSSGHVSSGRAVAASRPSDERALASEGGLLLGDAVDAAAAVEERPRVDADHPAARVGVAEDARATRRPARRRRRRR